MPWNGIAGCVIKNLAGLCVWFLGYSLLVLGISGMIGVSLLFMVGPDSLC